MTPLATLLATLAIAVGAPRAPAEAGSLAVHLSTAHPLLVLAPRRDAPRAALVVRFHAGSADDGELAGLTLVAQHALLEASRRLRYPELLRILVGADATLALETGLAECQFTLEAARDDFPRLYPLVLDLLLSPDIDPQRFDSALRSAQHAEREGSGRDVVALVASKVVDDPAFMSAPTGTEAGIEAISVEDVRRHLAAALTPANATVVFAGAFDASAARRAVLRHARGRAVRRAAPPVSTPFSLQIPARSEIYLLAFRTSYATAEDAAAARLAAALIAERIHWSFRDRGVGYSASVDVIRRRWIDLFAITLPGRAPAEEPLGGLLEREVAAVRDGRFSPEDLERNRAWALASLEATFEEPASLAAALADGDGRPWLGTDVVRVLRSLDRDAFVRQARRLLAEPESIRLLYSPRAAVRGAIPDAYRRVGSLE